MLNIVYLLAITLVGFFNAYPLHKHNTVYVVSCCFPLLLTMISETVPAHTCQS